MGTFIPTDMLGEREQKSLDKWVQKSPFKSMTEEHLLSIIEEERIKAGKKTATALVRQLTGYPKLVVNLAAGRSCTLAQANKLLKALGRPLLRSVDVVVESNEESQISRRPEASKCP